MSLAARIARRRDLGPSLEVFSSAGEPPAAIEAAAAAVAAAHPEHGDQQDVEKTILDALEEPTAQALPVVLVDDLASQIGVESIYLLDPAVADATDRADVIAALQVLGVAKTMRVCRDTSDQPTLPLLLVVLGIAGGARA